LNITQRSEDVSSLITGKLALKYAGRGVESMKAIANAAQKRSLADFQKVICVFLYNPNPNPNAFLFFFFNVFQ
jgi:hypothetical protein